MTHGFVILCLAVLLPVQSQQPTTTPAIHSQNSESKGQTEKTSPVAIHEPTPKKAPGETERDTKPDKHDLSADWVTLSAVMSAVATIFIAILGFLQWRAMNRQRVAMETQSTYMTNTLLETKKAANAARDSVIAASDTAIRQLRAYIAVHQVGVMGLRDATPFGVGFAFVNYGQTPASRFNLRGALDYLPYPLPEEYVLPDPPMRPAQDGLIYPKEPNAMTGWVWEKETEKLSVEAKLTLLSKGSTKEVYAHGTATYSDVFGITRSTKFCYVLNPHSVIRNNVGDVLHDKNGNIQFQWAPVANRNDIS